MDGGILRQCRPTDYLTPPGLMDTAHPLGQGDSDFNPKVPGSRPGANSGAVAKLVDSARGGEPNPFDLCPCIGELQTDESVKEFGHNAVYLRGDPGPILRAGVAVHA